MGVAVPANEVAERAERIRDRARGRRRLPARRPDRARRGADHRRPRPGPRPVPRGGLVRGPARRASPRPFLSADTYPNRSMFEGMSDDAVAALVREPVHAGGRAGFWGLDSAAPLVAGTYVAARGRGRRRADHGRPRPRRRDGRLRAVPAARPSRRAVDVRRLLLLQQRGDRGRGDRPGDRRAGRDPRRRLPPRQRHPADLLAPRRRPLRLDPRRPGPRLPVLPGPRRRDRRGRRGRGEPQPAAAGRDRPTRPTSRPSTGRSRRSPARPARSSSSRSASTRTGSIRSATFALTTDVYHEIGRRTAALGRRLVILQEGGYHRPSLGENARAWLRGAEGRPFDPLPAGGFGAEWRGRRLAARQPSGDGDGAGPDRRRAGRGRRRARGARRGPGGHRRSVRAAAAVGPRARLPDAAPHHPRAAGLARVGRAAFDRLRAAADPLTPARFLELSDDATLLAIGFSRQKARYGRALAAAVEIGHARPRRARGPRRRGRPRRAPGGARHRAVDLDDLPADGARPPGRLAGRRHRAGRVGRRRSRASRAGPTRSRWSASASLATVALRRRPAVLARLPRPARPDRLSADRRASRQPGTARRTIAACMESDRA